MWAGNQRFLQDLVYEEPAIATFSMCSGVCVVFFCLWHHIFCALCSCHSLTVYVWTGHPHCLYNSPAYNEELLKKKNELLKKKRGRR